jgi:signal transduction histidine kinase
MHELIHPTKMKLHEAIEYVLRSKTGDMTADKIAEVINEKGLYVRLDGQPIEAQQVILRVKQYKQTFTLKGNYIALNDMALGSLEYLAKQLRRLISETESRNSKLLLPSWFYFFRKNEEFENLNTLTGNFSKELFEQFYEFFVLQGFAHYESDKIVFPLLALSDINLIKMISMTKEIYQRDIDDSTFSLFFENLVKFEFNFEHQIPSDLSKIISHFIKTSESNFTVCDPFTISPNFLPDIINYNKTINPTYFLDVQNIDLAILTKLNFIVKKVQNFNLHVKDSFSNFDSIRYDYVVSCPPFGGTTQQFNSYSVNHYPHIFPVGLSSRVDVMSIQIIMSKMKENGKAVIVVPEGFLYSNNKLSIELRKYLLDMNLLDQIISLPHGMFIPYSSIKTSIIVLDKKRDRNKSILFQNLSMEEIKTFEPSGEIGFGGTILNVTKERIANNSYSLAFSNYVESTIQEAGLNLISLGELVNIKNIGIAVKPIHINFNAGIPYIKIKDLKGTDEFPKLEIAQVTTFVSDLDELQNNKVWSVIDELKAGTLLVAKNGLSIKATMVSDDTKALVSNNIIAFDVNRSFVSPEYLLSQFHEEYIIKQIDTARKGMVIPFLRNDDLLNIKVHVPTEQIQREIENKFFLKQRGDFKVLKNENDKIIGAIKHEFGNLYRPIASNLQLIKEYFKEKSVSGEPVKYSEGVTKRPDSKHVTVVIDSMQKQLNEMGNLLGDMQDLLSVDKDSSKKSMVEVLPFFKTIESAYLITYFDFDFDKVKTLTINESQFSKVIRNFIDNSIKHGFDNIPIDKGIIIKIRFGINDDIIIDLMNKGKPFDSDFEFSDYINFGSKSGANQGKGIGGYLINRIVENHGGKFELIDRIKVHFRITLPK